MSIRRSCDQEGRLPDEKVCSPRLKTAGENLRGSFRKKGGQGKRGEAIRRGPARLARQKRPRAKDFSALQRKDECVHPQTTGGRHFASAGGPPRLPVMHSTANRG